MSQSRMQKEGEGEREREREREAPEWLHEVMEDEPEQNAKRFHQEEPAEKILHSQHQLAQVAGEEEPAFVVLQHWKQPKEFVDVQINQQEALSKKLLELLTELAQLSETQPGLGSAVEAERVVEEECSAVEGQKTEKLKHLEAPSTPCLQVSEAADQTASCPEKEVFALVAMEVLAAGPAFLLVKMAAALHQTPDGYLASATAQFKDTISKYFCCHKTPKAVQMIRVSCD